MQCPDCKQTTHNNLDIYAIKRLKRCARCNKKRMNRLENNPELTMYEVEYEVERSDYAIIYAKTEREARVIFADDYCDEYTDILNVKEIKRKGFGDEKSV